MIVDSSAIIAVLQDEPEAASIVAALAAADRPAMSVATLVETAASPTARETPSGRHGSTTSSALSTWRLFRSRPRTRRSPDVPTVISGAAPGIPPG